MIELLVVIAIIAILAALLLPALTSYLWNVCTVGLGPFETDNAMSRYKLSELRPTGMLMWEGPEDMEAALFNDVGSHPHEGISQRHASARKARSSMDNVGGVATFGDLSGRSYTMKFSKWFTRGLAGSAVWPGYPAFDGPNDAWYSPSTKSGGP